MTETSSAQEVLYLIDTLDHIFDYCGDNDIVQCIPVCKQWSNYALSHLHRRILSASSVVSSFAGMTAGSATNSADKLPSRSKNNLPTGIKNKPHPFFEMFLRKISIAQEAADWRARARRNIILCQIESLDHPLLRWCEVGRLPEQYDGPGETYSAGSFSEVSEDDPPL